MKPRIGVATSSRTPEGPVLAAVERAYVDAVLAAGGLPLLLPTLHPADAAAVLDGLDGLLLTGGGDVQPARYGATDHPDVYGVEEARDDWEVTLAVAAVARDLPVLGICRGAQVINVAFGGSLVQHLPDVTDLAHRLPDMHDQLVHAVEIVPGSRLAAVVGATSLAANSLHHQAAGLIGSGLTVVATAPDGTVEAIEGTDGRRVLGVQWHPELLPTHGGHAALFGWLVAEAADELAAAVA